MKGGDNIQAVGVLICQTNLPHDKDEMSHAQLNLKVTTTTFRALPTFSCHL